MARYRLIGGIHYEGTGQGRTLYKKGDVVESDRDLVEVYANKFEPLGRDAKASAGKKAPFALRSALGVKVGTPGLGEPGSMVVSADEGLPYGNTRGAQQGVTRVHGGEQDEDEGDAPEAAFEAADNEPRTDGGSLLEPAGDEGGEPEPAAAPKKKKKAKGTKAKKKGTAITAAE